MVPHLFVIYISNLKGQPIELCRHHRLRLVPQHERLAEELRDQTLALHHIVLSDVLAQHVRFCRLEDSAPLRLGALVHHRTDQGRQVHLSSLVGLEPANLHSLGWHGHASAGFPLLRPHWGTLSLCNAL